MPVSTKVPPDLGFEGPEKTLDLQFSGACLRAVPRAGWEDLLTVIKAQIMSSIHNDHCDAYVLSESSLFVFSHRVLIKTCGTTTLLLALKQLLDLCAEHGAVFQGLYYSRKAFYYPQEQPYPHAGWAQEIQYLEDAVGPVKAFCEEGVDGWCLAVAQRVPDALPPVHMMMSRLPPAVCDAFIKRDDDEQEKPNRMSLDMGIDRLDPDATLDDHVFEPCGYSMNSLNDEIYATIHVTPERHCSYASYETNSPLVVQRMKDVLDKFQPDAFSVALFGGGKVAFDGYEVRCTRRMDSITFQHFEKRHRTVVGHVLDYEP